MSLFLITAILKSHQKTSGIPECTKIIRVFNLYFEQKYPNKSASENPEVSFPTAGFGNRQLYAGLALTIELFRLKLFQYFLYRIFMHGKTHHL